MLNHLIIPRNQKNVTRFCHIWLWIRQLLNNCLMILCWFQSPYNWHYLFVCLYLSLIDIIVMHISWAEDVMWLHWCSQVWRGTFIRRINKGAPIVNNPPSLQRFSLKVFSEGSNSTTVLTMPIFITVVSIIWFVCSNSWAANGVFLSIYFETK